LQQVLGGKPLPFIKGGISGNPGLFAATQVLLQDMECAIDPLEMDDALFDLATALQAASGVRTARQTLDYPAAQKAREFLLASWQRTVSLSELEAVSGRDRWRLSRDFRALFGTSPYRYLTLRRLDQVRRVMTQGHSLTDAAAIAGFSDQSHMTRHFVRTYGISPGRWLKMLGAR
jgi:AraC-like DNA-binding protein